MIRSTKNEQSTATTIAPAGDRTTTTTGTGVDVRGYGAATIVIAPSTITDGTHTPKVQESSASGSGYTDVAASDLDGSLAAINSDTMQSVGYLGTKRYLRVVVTVTGSPGTGGKYAALVVRSLPSSAP